MIGRRTILVVDDEAIIRGFIADAIRPDFEVIEARDGIEAIELYSLHAGCIVCVITDLLMPRLDGCSLIYWLREKAPLLPVVLMTGNAGGLNANRILSQPKALLLRKPFTLDELRRAIEESFASTQLTPR